MRRMPLFALKAGILAVAALATVGSARTEPDAAYRLVKTVPLGAPDRWDYVVADPATARVYIAHGDRVTVLDETTAEVVGQVEGIPGGTHGIAISTPTHQGFTDDGEKAKAVAFDLRTLRVLKRIPAADDADGMIEEPVTDRVFVVEGDPGTVTVIDPGTDRVVATIDLGEKPEYLAPDGAGNVLIAGEAHSDIVKVDARTATVVARWPTPDCRSPHGLAFDRARARVFMGCANERMVVVDTRSGHLVATLPIGKGSDAIAWDPVRRRLFSSNGGDGTVSVYRQVDADRYTAMPTIPTVVSARNMTVIPRTGRLVVVGADTDPNPAGGRRLVRAGTVRAMIYDPVR